MKGRGDIGIEIIMVAVEGAGGLQIKSLPTNTFCR